MPAVSAPCFGADASPAAQSLAAAGTSPAQQAPHRQRTPLVALANARKRKHAQRQAQLPLETEPVPRTETATRIQDPPVAEVAKGSRIQNTPHQQYSLGLQGLAGQRAVSTCPEAEEAVGRRRVSKKSSADSSPTTVDGTTLLPVVHPPPPLKGICPQLAKRSAGRGRGHAAAAARGPLAAAAVQQIREPAHVSDSSTPDTVGVGEVQC